MRTLALFKKNDKMSPCPIITGMNATILENNNIIARTPSRDEEPNNNFTKSSIAEFYEGSSIFVTGATGFLGKAVIEKLLRTTEVSTVYILIRASRGKTVQTRFDEFLSNSVFGRLRCTSPEAMTKVQPIVGDITLPNLGISPKDQERLHNEVSIVIHSAATIRFNEPLRVATEVNVAGTKRVLDLCRQMKNIKTIVHVSTAYANCDRDEIKEIVYPAPMDPHKLLKGCESFSDKVLEAMTPILLGGRPNTYTFTKAVAETLVEQSSTELPVCILRPSVVAGALNEPSPGWVDNWAAPTGIFASSGTGHLRTLFCHSEKVIDVIPVDLAANAIILASAWRHHHQVDSSCSCPVFTVCSGTENPLTFADFCRLPTLAWSVNPSNHQLWSPNFTPTSNHVWHNVIGYLLQCVPAHVHDFCMTTFEPGLPGQQKAAQKATAVKSHRKLHDMMVTTEFFCTHEFKFDSTNMRHLYERMRPEKIN